MTFKIWLENDYQQLFPFMTDEDPLTSYDKRKIKQFDNKEDYVKASAKGGRQTERAAEMVANSFVNGSHLGEEEVQEIYRNEIIIPAKQFSNITKPERYIALVHLKTIKPNIAGKYTHRLLALYQGQKDAPITKQSILDNEHIFVGSIVFQDGYITHTWISPEYRGLPSVNLYGKMREFLRKYYGVHRDPKNKLTSASSRASEAKHKWNRFHGKI